MRVQLSWGLPYCPSLLVALFSGCQWRVRFREVTRLNLVRSRHRDVVTQWTMFCMLLLPALQTLGGFLPGDFTQPIPQDLTKSTYREKGRSLSLWLLSDNSILVAWDLECCQMPTGSSGMGVSRRDCLWKNHRVGLCIRAMNTVSQIKIVVTGTRKLNRLNLLVLDCFWRVSNSMIFTCHRLEGKKSQSETS